MRVVRARVPRGHGGLNARGAGRALLAALVALAGAAAQAAEPAPEAPPRELVVLVHGLGRSDLAMWPLGRRLEEVGYAVHAVDYASTRKTPDELVADLAAELARCCAAAPRVHFVTHSLGSLLVRAQLAAAPPPQLGRVVMLAPPNRGSELADWLGDSEAFRLVMGPTAPALATGPESFPNRLPPATFEVGVIAGTESLNPLGSHLIPGEDDGTVSVARTQLPGMRDFVRLPVSHTMILLSRAAAEQAVAFLRTGRFVHAPAE